MLLLSPGLLYILYIENVLVYTYIIVPVSPIALTLLLFLEQLREEAICWTRSSQSWAQLPHMLGCVSKEGSHHCKTNPAPAASLQCSLCQSQKSPTATARCQACPSAAQTPGSKKRNEAIKLSVRKHTLHQVPWNCRDELVLLLFLL